MRPRRSGRIFWEVHDPTQLARAPTRSAIFFHSPEQEAAAARASNQFAQGDRDEDTRRGVPPGLHGEADGRELAYGRLGASLAICSSCGGPAVPGPGRSSRRSARRQGRRAPGPGARRAPPNRVVARPSGTCEQPRTERTRRRHRRPPRHARRRADGLVDGGGRSAAATEAIAATGLVVRRPSVTIVAGAAPLAGRSARARSDGGRSWNAACSRSIAWRIASAARAASSPRARAHPFVPLLEVVHAGGEQERHRRGDQEVVLAPRMALDVLRFGVVEHAPAPDRLRTLPEA